MLKQTHKIASKDLRVRFAMFKQIMANLQILISQEFTEAAKCLVCFDGLIVFQNASCELTIISFESLRSDMRIRPSMPEKQQYIIHLKNNQLSVGLVQELLLFFRKYSRQFSNMINKT